MVAAHRHSEPQLVQRQRVHLSLHAPEETTKSASMPRQEAPVKEEVEVHFVVAMPREVEAEVAERQHLRQHLLPSLRQPKHKHHHNRTMPRLHPLSPTASRLYDPSHPSMADIL